MLAALALLVAFVYAPLWFLDEWGAEAPVVGPSVVHAVPSVPLSVHVAAPVPDRSPRNPDADAPMPSAGHPLWRANGAFTAWMEYHEPEPIMARLGRHGWRWVALQATDGAYRQYELLLPRWLAAARASGLAVCGWGMLLAEPEREAELAAAVVREHGLDCWIANAEAYYKADDPVGDWGRSTRFVARFRELLPDLPAALSTYGAAPAPWVLPIDYAAWLAGGFDLLPQAYLYEGEGGSPLYSPANAVAHALRAGYPLERVHLTVGLYGEWTGQRYAPLVARSGTTGVSVWVAQAAGDDDLAMLALAAR